MFKQLSRKGKNIYVGEALRDRLDKIVLNIGHYIGRPVTISEFIHYVIERHGDEAKENLKHILGTEEERTKFDKKRWCMLSTTAFLALAMQCAPSVHPDTVLDIARVESGFNPYAIAEIIPKSERKLTKSSVISHFPANKAEALKRIKQIEEKNIATLSG